MRRGAILRSFVLLGSLALTACGGGGKDGGGSSGPGSTPSAPESAYCSTVSSYSNPVTLTATALFEYRRTCPTTTYTGCSVATGTGLVGNPITAGIPYAEVIVSAADGATVQCGLTDANGLISVQVPAGAATYTLTVKSRSDSARLKVSVLEDRTGNAPYSISTSVSVASGATTADAGTLTARARVADSAKIEGGAFNILAQIAKANDYLRATLSDSSFVAPKVTAYWKMGFNPYSYFGSANTLLSFYRNGLAELYILGGTQGNVSTVDTDHFDNSVILHEYAHFLEDTYAFSESPGGSHNGDFIIDARLAWGEGWANFFQAAVLAHADPNWKWYIDTEGYSGDTAETGESGRYIIRFDLTQSGGSASLDAVSTPGEGTFRELSISRFLFKTIRTVANGGAEIPFRLLWKAFSEEDFGGSPIGMASSQLSFRNIGLFNQFLATNINAEAPSSMTAWNSLRSNEQQNNVPKDYANPLTLQAENSCAMIGISPVSDDSLYNVDRSDLLRSNDFYLFVHDGAPKTLSLSYTGGSADKDLDLYVYAVDHYYFEDQYRSEGDNPSDYGVSGLDARVFSLENGSEQVALGGLPAGRYLINVKANTYEKTHAQVTGGSLQYRLKLTTGSTTEDLCPVH